MSRVLRFRLLVYADGTRTWTVDDESHPRQDVEVATEAYTFFATDNGPGLAPTPRLGKP